MALESQSLNLDLDLTVTFGQQSDTKCETILVIEGDADHGVLMVDILVGLKIYLKVTKNRELLWHMPTCTVI